MIFSIKSPYFSLLELGGNLFPVSNSEIYDIDIPKNYKQNGNIIQGNITFGEEYSPAMIKIINKNIKDITCYVGITLE